MIAGILPYSISLRYAHLYGKITEIVISEKYSEAIKIHFFSAASLSCMKSLCLSGTDRKGYMH